MAGLPRSIIKKYGVSKKAWAVYRGNRISTKKHYSGVSMARRRYGRRRGGSRGGFGMGRLLSMKNIAFTVGAAVLLPKVLGLDSKLSGAAGGFIGAGPIGAVVGYLAGPMANSALGGLAGGDAQQGAW